jgi:hypothetical protein
MQSVKKLKLPMRGLRYKLGLLIGPLIIVVLAGIISYGVGERFQREQIDKFDDQANNVLEVATIKLESYVDLLYTGRAFVLSSPNVTSPEWKTFYSQYSLFTRYSGVSSVAYIRNVSTQDLTAFQAKMKTTDYFGPTYQLKGVSERSTHGLINVISSNYDATPVVGLDLTARNDRYEFYRSVEAKKTIVASPPTMLAIGQQGFVTTLPVFKGDKLDGYVVATYVYKNLIKELFADRSFGHKVTDVTPGFTPTVIDSSQIEGKDVSKRESIVKVGGRSLKVEISKQTEKRPLGYLLPAVIVTTGGVMALTLYAYSKVSSRERKARQK